MIIVGIGLMILSMLSLRNHVKFAKKNDLPLDNESLRLAFINAAAGRSIVLLEAVNQIFPGSTTLLVTGIIGFCINMFLIINGAISIRRIRLRDQAKLDELQRDVDRQMARLEHWIKESERNEQK